jgi:DNA mismatch repair ATPase MutL
MLQDLHFIAQLDKKIIIASFRTKDTTTVIAIDQHAAHERIRLEKLQRDVNSCTQTQSGSTITPYVLDQPLIVQVDDTNLWTKHKSMLKSWYWNYDLVFDGKGTRYERYELYRS